MKTTVHTLSITHRHGVNLTVHPSRADLDATLDAYVKEWWKDEMGDEPMPSDRADAYDMYFDHVEDEFCDIESHTIEVWEPKDSMTGLLKDAVEVWAQFDTDKGADPATGEGTDLDVNGGDLVEWFGEWRERAKAVVAEVGEVE